MRNRYGLFAACADSRVAPEPVFSRNIDELSMVRNAGNVANAAALGSAGYSAAAFGCPPPATMEHASRGATAAAVDVVKKSAAFPGSTGPGSTGGRRAPDRTACADGPRRRGDLPGDAVRENATMVEQSMVVRGSVLQDAFGKEEPRVVAARHGVANGRVEFLGG